MDGMDGGGRRVKKRMGTRLRESVGAREEAAD